MGVALSGSLMHSDPRKGAVRTVQGGILERFATT